MSIRKLMLSLIVVAATLSPAMADDDLNFGAAITAVFNKNCRPVTGTPLK
jgi:hypothetical protein